jgi:hypothetical protein
MAEREGFEPPELSLNGFQDRRLKPLGHLSVKNIPLKRSEPFQLLEAGFGAILSTPPI